MGRPKDSARLFDWAAFYRDLGFSVIPLWEGKRPAVQWKEFQSRTATRAELGRWFINAGWGMALVCGSVSGNLCRLDFDDPEDYPKVCAELPYPTFVSQRKGGGYGVLLRSPSAVPLLPQKTFKKYPKLELRGEGSITVVPPTPGYRWLDDHPIVGDAGLKADVPALLTRLFGFDLSNRQKLADSIERTAGDELATMLRETEVGERSNNLVRIAGMLRARGLDLETALVVMEHNFTEHWQSDDMPWEQARGIFEQAWRRYESEGVRFSQAPKPADNPDEKVVAMRLDEIAPPKDEQSVLIDHFLLAGEAGNTLIAAPAKIGKTSLLLDASITATRGDLVWGALKVMRPLKIAFIDQERKFLQIRENQILMAGKIGLPNYDNFLLLVQETGQFEANHAAVMAQLRARLDSFGPDVVVIDGWGWFVGHQASDPKLVTPALAWLKAVRQSLGCATVIIHHFKKDQFAGGRVQRAIEDPADMLDKIEGLKRLVDQAQTALVYTPIAGSDTFNLLEGRTNKTTWDPIKFVIDYDDTTVTHRIVSAEEGSELFDPDTFRRLWAQTAATRHVKQAINTICIRMNITRSDIADRLGVNKTQVSRWYSGLANPSQEYMAKLEEMWLKAKTMPLNLKGMPRPAKGAK
jgi:DNA-binding transcriptional regulator YiaG